MKEELICILCPLGCQLSVEHDGGEIKVVTGNECKRGLSYSEKEIFHPERTVTTTVRIQGSFVSLLPVKTDAPVAKNLTQDVVHELSTLVVEAPVESGDVVLSDVLGTGSNMVATRSVPKRPAKGDVPGREFAPV